jgi:hypothetical protein
LANGGYAYDPVGVLWNRIRGDTTNGLWVNVKSSVAGTIAGAKTPGDGLANPTDAVPTQSYNAMWNTVSWDRVRGDTTSGLWVNVKAQTAPTLNTVSTASASTIVSAQVAMDDTAGGRVIKASTAARRSIIIRNVGLSDVWIGPTAGLTTATGMVLKPTETITLDRTTAAIYGICGAATTTTVAYLEEL